MRATYSHCLLSSRALSSPIFLGCARCVRTHRLTNVSVYDSSRRLVRVQLACPFDVEWATMMPKVKRRKRNQENIIKNLNQEVNLFRNDCSACSWRTQRGYDVTVDGRASTCMCHSTSLVQCVFDDSLFINQCDWLRMFQLRFGYSRARACARSPRHSFHYLSS